MIDLLLDSALVRSMAWALLNSIWQGTLIGVGTALALHALRRASANARYLIACLGLLLMLLVPLSSLVPSRGHASLDALWCQAVNREFTIHCLTPGAAAVAPMDRILPLAFIIWVVGVVLSSIRLVVGCLGIQRLKRATRNVDERLSRRLRLIAHRLGVERSVRVFESSIVRVPTVVGYLRPVILLPASVITGLSTAHLDAVLAHELAHVRRHDYLVNVLQSIVETLLFYHPAVWWCSRQIRAEREHCCDDLVIEACGDPVTYATALAQLEELRGVNPMLAMNVTGGRLIHRVRRVLKQSPVRNGRTTSWMMVPAVTLLAVAITLTPALTTAEAESLVLKRQADSTLADPTPAPVPPRPVRPVRPPRPVRPVQPVAPAQAPVPPAIPAPPSADPALRSPAPAAPAAPPAPPIPADALVPPWLPTAPLPPEPPPIPDVSDLAEELSRTAAELASGVDEMRNAIREIAKQQVQVAEVQAALERMKRELPAMAEVQKQIEALRLEMQKLRAR